MIFFKFALFLETNFVSVSELNSVHIRDWYINKLSWLFYIVTGIEGSIFKTMSIDIYWLDLQKESCHPFGFSE